MGYTNHVLIFARPKPGGDIYVHWIPKTPSPMFPHHPYYLWSIHTYDICFALSRNECPLYPKITDFCRWLLKMYSLERLAATDVTACAWHLGPFAHALGVDHLALEPSEATGNSQKLLDKALGLDRFAEQDVYWEPLPYQQDTLAARTQVPHPFLLPSETIKRIHANDRAQLYCTDQEMLGLPRFEELKILRQHKNVDVVLCRAYVDGASYSGRARKGGDKKVICFFWNVCHDTKAFHTRKVITVLDSESLCQSCGCGGRCTVVGDLIGYKRWRHT